MYWDPCVTTGYFYNVDWNTHDHRKGLFSYQVPGTASFDVANRFREGDKKLGHNPVLTQAYFTPG